MPAIRSNVKNNIDIQHKPVSPYQVYEAYKLQRELNTDVDFAYYVNNASSTTEQRILTYPNRYAEQKDIEHSKVEARWLSGDVEARRLAKDSQLAENTPCGLPQSESQVLQNYFTGI